MSAQPTNILEKQAGEISWRLRASGIDDRYLHSAARHQLTTGQSLRDSEVIKEAKRRQEMVVAAVEANRKRFGMDVQ